MAVLRYDVRGRGRHRTEEEVDPDVDDVVELLDEMDDGFDSFLYQLDDRSGIDLCGSVELGFTVHVSEANGLWRLSNGSGDDEHVPFPNWGQPTTQPRRAIASRDVAEQALRTYIDEAGVRDPSLTWEKIPVD